MKFLLQRKIDYVRGLFNYDELSDYLLNELPESISEEKQVAYEQLIAALSLDIEDAIQMILDRYKKRTL